MSRIKQSVICVIFCMAVIMIQGCGSGILTREEIVSPRKEEGETEGDGRDSIKDGQDLGKGGISLQVQAPERYIWEGGSGIVNVKADAAVNIPEAEGFKIYKVTGRRFTQEDYDKVNQALLKGASVDEWDDGKEVELKEKQRQDIEVNILAKENMQEQGNSYWMGRTIVDGKEYCVEIDNNLEENSNWRWINFSIRCLDYNSVFLWAESSGWDMEGILKEAVRQEAVDAVVKMGFTEFVPAGEEYAWSFSGGKESKGIDRENYRSCYGIHFMRQMDGIPVTYTYNTGESLDDYGSVSWPYEMLDMIYDKDGLVYFSWSNPYQVEKLSDEQVFLIPFSDIQNVFEEMMLKKYNDVFADMDVQVEYQIKEVRLGYMRVMEKGNITEGKMIPVWDFFGSERIYYADLKEPYVEDGPYNSYLTINAMDGTIIDRGFGY